MEYKVAITTLLSWPIWQHNGPALADPHLSKTECICPEVPSLPMSETAPEQGELTVRSIRNCFYQPASRMVKQEEPTVTLSGSSEDHWVACGVACGEHWPLYHIECDACQDELHHCDQSLPLNGPCIVPS
jgi:hypothetical protein